MSGSELLGTGFGLASALSWGAGDFSGGLASKRSPVFGVVLTSQGIGLVLLVSLALLSGEPLPATANLFWGAAAGLAGGLGLLVFYRGLARGPMGVVAPVNAVVSAGVPVLWAAAFEGLPAARQLAGFGLALLAVWLVSRSGDGVTIHPRDLGLPLLSGLGFGAFLIIIGEVSATAVYWPLTAARLASISLLLVITALRRQQALPNRRLLPLLALVGLCDTGGNAFYALATQAGRLDVAAVLSSLYPAVTVLLARFVLKEPVSARQWIGVAAATVAVGLIAA
jgi:drug/metabolite transporter (DMT)-like permease